MKKLFLLLSIILILSAIAVLTSCNNTANQSDTTVSDTQLYESTPNDTSAEETVPETATDDTSVAEITTAEETTVPESLELPEGYTVMYDAEKLKSGKAPINSTSAVTDNIITYTATGNDPYAYVIKDKITVIGRYFVLKYRTTAEIDGQIFIGVDNVTSIGMQQLNYTADGQWHVLKVDMLNNDGFSGGTVKYLRFDFLDGENVIGKSVDVEWIACYPDDGAEYTKTLPEREPIADLPNVTEYTQLGDSYYKASGYESADGNTFTFKSGFEMNVYYRAESFNRYTLKYTSSSPIEGQLTYLVGNGEEKTETFYLEAGTDASFSSLIDSYFNAEYAYGISRVTMKTCDNSTATFTILGFDSNAVPVYGAGTYYIENSHYRVGVLLKWGGGISYIEDKRDNDQKLSNLINHCDTGRLIQQSYYGTSDSSVYECGTYGGNTWGYNPVQGGDMFGNASKIVDVKVSADGRSIYVKARPMDWAKNNSPCPAYMENTYTLLDDAIMVDNRFVDFFGTSHPSRHQELPAFYTISYLGVFHYYNGTQPWTNGEYETLPNEEFWGGRGSAYHNIKSGNTETWAAWTSKSGYGIGLYVPGTEIMLAGRNAYNGSRSDTDGATNYVAPLRTMKIVDFEPYEYTYYIATGTVDQMRDTFKAYATN